MAEEGAAQPLQIDSGPAGAYVVNQTRPDEILRHDISDEELDMLCEGKRDNIWEAMWAALGAALGGLPSAISALSIYLQSDARTLALVDLSQIIIFFVASAAAAGCALVVVRRVKNSSSLQTRIRARNRRSQTS